MSLIVQTQGVGEKDHSGTRRIEDRMENNWPVKVTTALPPLPASQCGHCIRLHEPGRVHETQIIFQSLFHLGM